MLLRELLQETDDKCFMLSEGNERRHGLYREKDEGLNAKKRTKMSTGWHLKLEGRAIE